MWFTVSLSRCEGRTWYSTHRGRLWIAATSKVPSAKDVLDTQQFYMERGRYGGERTLVVGCVFYYNYLYLYYNSLFLLIVFT